jgi:hypothetical protein
MPFGMLLGSCIFWGSWVRELNPFRNTGCFLPGPRPQVYKLCPGCIWRIRTEGHIEHFIGEFIVVCNSKIVAVIIA